MTDILKSVPAFIYAPPQEDLRVLHEDDDLLVLSKPSGLLSVPGRAADHQDCLQNRVLEQYPDALLIHRLDVETSGVFLMTRNRAAQKHIGQQFEFRKTQKTYIARVWGNVEGDSGRVDLPLRCDWDNRPRQMVCHEHGKPSQTDWRVLERENMGSVTRMELSPITGRSHQLRVHMEALGYPILGEVFYAPDDARDAADRLQLHAQRLEIEHPTRGEQITFEDLAPF